MVILAEWRRLHRARGNVPLLVQMAGNGGTTSNWPNCTDHHESARQKRPILLVEPKVEGHDQKKIFSASRAAGRVPLPHFQIRSGATGLYSAVLYSF